MRFFIYNGKHKQELSKIRLMNEKTTSFDSHLASWFLIELHSMPWPRQHAIFFLKDITGKTIFAALKNPKTFEIEIFENNLVWDRKNKKYVW